MTNFDFWDGWRARNYQKWKYFGRTENALKDIRPIFFFIILQRNFKKYFWECLKGFKSKDQCLEQPQLVIRSILASNLLPTKQVRLQFFPKITLFTEEMTPVRYIEYFILYLGLFICGLATGIILIAGLLRLNQIRDNFVSFYQLFDNQKSWRRSNETY